ncbi:MAG: prepilin-type N-terminal cleavage/methylation domain-containing protein [Verrucomicrobia bacterium]|nr:prepilin-type N-terminal cleavage/methylation domain-containing protein [Verrucomicrobiota bacterium]
MHPPSRTFPPFRAKFRGFTLVEIMVVVVIIGLLASLAIPGFQQVRRANQDKAVLNNARQLASAAEQYFHEFGEAYVDFNNLVGATNYVKAFALVANETYPSFYTQATPITVLGLGGTRTITYSP